MQRVFYITKNRKIKIELGMLNGWELFIKNNYRFPARRICLWLGFVYITVWIDDPNR
jgi:hypothetical protein